MASIYSAIECPHCGRSAVRDFYYKSNEEFVACYRCGYNYTRVIKKTNEEKFEFVEDKRKGYGLCSLVKKDGERKTIVFNFVLKVEDIEKYRATFFEEEVDQESSYFVSFNEGLFKILAGNPPENFHLSFKNYKEKMIEKYREFGENLEIMVPFEE
jgi:Zn ribbon nucleic-acid-binding protein